MHRGKRLISIMPKALRSTMAFLLVAATVFSMASLALIEPVLAAPTPVSIERVSVPCVEGNEGSQSPSISADGRYVAFQSAASNLVLADYNGADDVFVRDRWTGEITRVSVDSNGDEGNNDSTAPSISGDGRYVAFESMAGNLVAGDGNGVYDVFVHDRITGDTIRVSLTSDNTEANSLSWAPSISADGRYVAFESLATNLVAGDGNGASDVFIRDWQEGTTTRVSVDSAGAQGNGPSLAASISADGRYVAFESQATNLVTGDTNSKADVFVRDCQLGKTARVSVDSDGNEGDDASATPSISADGRYVAFQSSATNLTDDETGGFAQVYGRDLQTALTVLVSVDSSGTVGNGDSDAPVSISADGRWVSFASEAPNLVDGDDNGHQDVFVRDMQPGGATLRASVDSDGNQSDGDSSYPAISADGRFVAFESQAANLAAGDTNSKADVFARDLQTPETTRVSLGSDDEGNNDSIYTSVSADGRYVAFYSFATNLVAGDANGFTDVFVRDRWTGETALVSLASDNVTQGNGNSVCPSISADGRYVAFQSAASNLVAADGNSMVDIFVRDRETGETRLVSLAYDDSQANLDCFAPSISADGRYVAFESRSTNLVADDTNGSQDVFVRDLQPGGTTVRISVRSNGDQGSGDSNDPSISADGRYVAFESYANDLVDGDSGFCDIFVRDCELGVAARVSVAVGPVAQGNGNSLAPSISSDGRYVAFQSSASNLVTGDSNARDDVFVYDRQAASTARVSVASGGAQSNEDSEGASISADGQRVAFESTASNLVADDDNGRDDIFVHDRQASSTVRVSVASSGTQSNEDSEGASISADGQCVAFESVASNLVPDDGNGFRDAFVVSWENPVLGFVPTSIDFGAQYQDSTENATLQVQNTGTGVLTYSLSEDSDWCSVTPDSGESSTEPDGFLVAIDTSGLVPGEYGCAVIISSNGGTGIVPVHVSVQPTPVIGVSPAIHDFGTVDLGSSAEQVITVSNSGTGDLIIGTVAAVDPVEAPYSIVSDNCSGQTVLPGDNTTLTVRFSPTIKGEFNEIFDIPSNDPHMPSFNVDVSGDTPNTAPTAPGVSITPDSPDAAADLVCNITTESTDPDGDSVTYTYKWLKDGLEQTALTGNTVGAAETAKDEDWQCVVTPYDGMAYGPSAQDEVTIQNAAPAAPVVNITPDSPDTTADLVCAITTESTDLDGDTVTYSYQWYKGGVVQVGFTTSTVGAAETARDQVWKCVVAAGDGKLTSALVEDEVTIQDAAPTAPVLAITPESPSSGDDLVCSIATASDDADGDNVTYSYQWYKDGELQTDLTTDTVGAGETGDGQVWKCVATPSDGILDGPSAEAEVTILAGGGFPAGAIVGIVIGVLAVAGLAGFFLIKRPKKASRF